MPYKDQKNGRKIEHERRKSLKLCTACSQPKDTNLSKCSRCFQKEKSRMKSLAQSRIQSGLCPHCGIRPPITNRKHCKPCLKQAMQYHWAHREHANAKTREHQHALKLEVLKVYGGSHPACKCCGEHDLLLLNLDHIKNDGNKHRKSLRSSYIYPWLKKNGFPEGFQILCFNCNIGKYHNKGTCPAATEHAKLKELRLQIQEREAIQNPLEAQA